MEGGEERELVGDARIVEWGEAVVMGMGREVNVLSTDSSSGKETENVSSPMSESRATALQKIFLSL